MNIRQIPKSLSAIRPKTKRERVAARFIHAKAMQWKVVISDLDMHRSISPNERDDELKTLVMVAAGQGNNGVLEQLAERGAVLGLLDSEFRSALIYAIEGEKVGTARWIFENVNKISWIHDLAIALNGGWETRIEGFRKLGATKEDFNAAGRIAAQFSLGKEV